VRVEQFLEHSAARLPDKTALVCGDQRLSYADINQEADRVAGLLASHGVQRGDRVAIYLENSVEAVVGVFAALKAGAVFVLVNASCKPQKLEYLLNNSRATALVCHARQLAALHSLATATPHLRVVMPVTAEVPHLVSRKIVVPYSTPCAVAVPAAAQRGIDIDLAALAYTSGSTGQAKGVMLTHLNIVSAATSITTYLENTESDVILSVLPLSFDYGLYQVLMAFKVGAMVVLERSFAYPHATLEVLVRERVTGLPIVPTLAAILRQLDLRRYDFSTLRYITNTGAALPTQHVRELRALVPHARLYLMYGLTECKRASYLPPDQVDIRPDSVGRAMPNEEVYIVDDAGNRLAAGVGELVVRGSNVMKGYWEMPEETNRVLKPGSLPGERVLHTGDIFRVDEEGYLYFLGRKDDIIKTRGEKVSPKEVEDVLHSLSGVAQAVVVGVPDPILGQAIKAVVTLRAGASLTVAEVRRHCAGHLEDFMVPKVVEFRASMPTTTTGKVDLRNLHASAAS
jgi:amino acid adenylation domain-containing protein